MWRKQITFVKDVKLNLDYENSIETSEKNTSDRKSSIKDLMAFKLNELQSYAKDNDIDITKIVDGKIKNKTKKELCSELEKKVVYQIKLFKYVKK